MKIVVFGLTISSSWGNGHATLWRGLCRALHRQGHKVVFFERNTPYYAANRDQTHVPGGSLVLYDDWESAHDRARQEVADADAAIITSYCRDGIAATDLVNDGRAIKAFYDLDTPVTLSRLACGEHVSYLGPRGLADFDIVLSYTGGAALLALRDRLGARRVLPLYGHVDPDVHRPAEPLDHYRSGLSYLGTYSSDRQSGLAALLIEPARCRPKERFLIAGAQYPEDFPWHANIYFVRHLPPGEHSSFFSSSRLTLNVTREPMARMGFCPSGRLFEAAACGTAIMSDIWSGLEEFFTPDSEIFAASDTDDALAIIDLDDSEIRRVATAARERVLAEHTSEQRAKALIAALESVGTQSPEPTGA